MSEDASGNGVALAARQVELHGVADDLKMQLRLMLPGCNELHSSLILPGCNDPGC